MTTLKLPNIGFGTYLLKGQGGVEATLSALEVGYRLLDTAYNYENEGTIGEAIRQSGLNRDEIIVTSKLPGRFHKYDLALTAIEESLYRMNLDTIDLYLIHWPNPLEGNYVEAWRALIEAKKRGYIKEIGVSNFLPEHIDKLYKETGVYPFVNQLECHPYFNQKDVLEYHKEHGILVEAWSPLGRASNVLEDNTLNDIAKSHNKSIGQVILKWHLQSGIIPIPKSSSIERQKVNFDLYSFELTQEEMSAIDKLSKPDGRLKNQDPATYQEF